MMLKDDNKANVIINSNFKMGTTDRLNNHLKDTRGDYEQRYLIGDGDQDMSKKEKF